MGFQIIREDITRIKADAIVNSANPNPVYADGTDRAIYEAAGAEELLKERREIGVIARGQAAVTGAYALRAKYIIHTVGPIWEGGNSNEEETLRNCYRNSLQLACDLGCSSIAVPLIAAGVYGFPKEKALLIAMEEIRSFLDEQNMDITLAVFNKEAFRLSGTMVEAVREYVSDHYVEEHSYDRIGALPSNLSADLPPDLPYTEMCPAGIEAECMEDVDGAPASLPKSRPSRRDRDMRSSGRGKVRIDDLVKKREKTFQEKLFEIIDERGLTGPQVYKNYISKQVYSKIQADKYYHPNKFTAIALCLSLQLTLEETLDLIGRAGWTLSPSNKADLVVKGCILNSIFNLVQVNIILFDFDCPALERIK